jgi:nicotinamidase-related amidase
MMPSHAHVSPHRATLLIIDVQEKLAAAMPGDALDRLVKNVAILAEAARRFGLPVVVSEQYPKGLGRTLPAIEEALAPLGAQVKRIEKIEFSVDGNAGFSALRRGLGRDQWVVAGMEAHVCVWQSVRDLRNHGDQVHVLADAVTSRSDDNRRIGLGLAAQVDAVVSSTEVVVFDLLGKAGSDDFKALSKLIR